MPISQIVKLKCSECGSLAKEKSRIKFSSSSLITLECGHCISENVLSSTNHYEEIVSSDGKTLMPFQIEGIKFVESANGRALIGDEQGLGKTVQALGLLSLHYDEMIPVVIATKATIKMQWMKQIFRWLPNRKPKVQILFSGKEIAVPGYDIYITSYAALSKDSIWEYISPKAIILDECQQITNVDANRTKGAQKIGKDCEYVIGMSGTAIRNHAGEYFPILNLIRPTMFPEHARFLREDCDSYESGWSNMKVGGLKDPKRFHEKTKDFIIRRTQEEVLPDLFALQMPRQFHHVELDRKFNKAYAALLEELEELYYSEENFDTPANRLAILNRMRYITGMSKTTECIDFVTEFLLSTNRKIAIFCHHHDVVNLLEQKLNDWLLSGGFNKVVVCRAGDDSNERIRQLNNANSRVMILSGLAAGEGMDGLQEICSDEILLERWWNPASEEQIEKRVARMGQTKPVNTTYMIASETVDDYFTELVEAKRGIVSSTLDNKEIAWEQNSLLKELTEILVMKGAKKWTL